MFNNIGAKIKKLAEILSGIGIAISIIAGGAVMSFGSDANSRGDNGGTIIIGLLIMIAGSFLSWIGGFFTYGFGELIERTCLIEERSRNSRGFTGGSRLQQLDLLLAQGLITREEYNQKIAESQS